MKKSSTYVALLRGINVGRHNRISMTAVRALFEDHGAERVSTYLQSGNVVFTSSANGAELAEGVEGEFQRRHGLRVTVVIRTGTQLAKVLAGNPFSAEGDPRKLHVAFLATTPNRTRVRGLDPVRVEPDEFRLVGREVYLHYPKGYGRSKLTNDYLERQLGVATTMRNWRTVAALAELVGAR